MIISLLYSLAVPTPLYYFHGYSEGYYTILDYRPYYSLNQQPVSMPITNYIRHVSIVSTILSAGLLVLAIASLIIAGRRLPTAADLVYGVVCGLVILYGYY